MISNNVVCAYTQSDQSHCLSFEYFMTVKLLTKQYLEFLSLIGGCRGLSNSTLVKMPQCWKSHVAAQLCFKLNLESIGKAHQDLGCTKVSKGKLTLIMDTCDRQVWTLYIQ